MAEPKPAAPANFHPSHKPHRHHHHHANHAHIHTHHFPHHFPYYYHYSYPTESAEAARSNGATSPAKFFFGPGFEPQTQSPAGGFRAGPSPGHNGSEYVVLFHVNPGVTISFQMGDNFEILRGESLEYCLGTLLEVSTHWIPGNHQ